MQDQCDLVIRMTLSALHILHAMVPFTDGEEKQVWFGLCRVSNSS